MAEIGSDIEKAASFLEAGELVAIPTETVYGLAANGLNPEAVLSIFTTKNRPQFDPLILHTYAMDCLESFTKGIPAVGQRLAEQFWPGPLTLILDKKSQVPDLVSSGLPTVAVRIPKHPLTLALLQKVKFPLAAPSANPFGYVSPTTAQHVQDQLGQAIPYILEGGPAEIGIESTIIGFEGAKVLIYRLGGKSKEEIEDCIGKKVFMKGQHSSSNPSAPGMLSSHYAPGKKVMVGDIDQLLKKYAKEKIGLLCYQEKRPSLPDQLQFVLSPSAKLAEAAQNLFSFLRQMDQLDIDYILAERVPNEGIGKAINDRLKRASAKREGKEL